MKHEGTPMAHDRWYLPSYDVCLGLLVSVIVSYVLTLAGLSSLNSMVHHSSLLYGPILFLLSDEHVIGNTRGQLSTRISKDLARSCQEWGLADLPISGRDENSGSQQDELL